jgi:preprotein translocase subunit SecB
MLAPINFDAVFAQAVMQAQQQAEANAAPAESALN